MLRKYNGIQFLPFWRQQYNVMPSHFHFKLRTYTDSFGRQQNPFLSWLSMETIMEWVVVAGMKLFLSSSFLCWPMLRARKKTELALAMPNSHSVHCCIIIIDVLMFSSPKILDNYLFFGMMSIKLYLSYLYNIYLYIFPTLYYPLLSLLLHISFH